MVLLRAKLREIYCSLICLKYSNKKVVRDDTNDGKRNVMSKDFITILMT
ncbi:hypothetical protein SAMN06265367_101130 [Algoriphagus winogradskyi]|uniref:Uncharacterized protein n=1 Tax=Algoriphagus winogradskyi TaxID=237017 RepID=A0ABY1NAF8_9BACT|nr:hypothetical protein SAMN06265367_101130 [Algoriphagus winogradskyi]